MSTKILLTYEDYLALPNDGKRYEIIRGNLYVLTTPVTRHQVVLARLFEAMADFSDTERWGVVMLSPLDVLLSQSDIVQPDILVIHAARKDIIQEKYVAGAPDLIVEIVSESTRRNDKVLKLKLYADFGVKEYWIVDPVIDTVEIYAPTAEGGLSRISEISSGAARSRLLEGFSIETEELLTREI